MLFMIYQAMTEDAIGGAMKVHRVPGPGIQEYTYQRATEIELKTKTTKPERKAEIKICYKDEYSALRCVDLLVEERLTVVLKAKTDSENTRLAQAINCLEASHYPIGLLINFGAKSLQFKRIFNKKIPR